jgi:hypothetical protein
MTIIYLLTGTHPAELAQVNGRVKFKAEIGKRFDRWLAQMIEPHLDKRFDSAQVAQAALADRDGSCGDFGYIEPENRRVQLVRDRDRLKLTLHTSSSTKSAKSVENLDSFLLKALVCMSVPGMLIWIILSLLPSLLIGIIPIIAIIFFPPIYLLLFCIYFFPVRPLLLLICKINDRISKEYTMIIIKDKELSEYKYSGNMNQPESLPRMSKRSRVKAVIYKPGYTFDNYVDVDGRSIRLGTVSIGSELTLLLTSEQYIVGGDLNLSQAELGWLGQELSDFLDLKLQIIYPTPRLPVPEVSEVSDDL